ncbi:hypothetical protein F2Q68_00031908 [Brassica cretica]|uniref:MULE transposase domain-containing protein n=1 Tax=Brassica cretica TaxID=69181 RepID=A0A8S9G8U2_BRACR|nr:hypothetical protein F2Q68_00031908 [Brassica cretica]
MDENESNPWYITDSGNVTIISDKATSIATAVSRVYPQAHHGFCIVHLARNVNARYSSKGLARMVTAAATAPIGDPRDEDIPEVVRKKVLMPPVTKRPAGRRKRKHFLSTGEIPGPNKNVVPNKCGKCRGCKIVGSFRTGHGKDLDSFFGFMDAKMWMICVWFDKLWLGVEPLVDKTVVTSLHTQGSFVVRQVVARCCTLSHPNEVLWLGKLWSRCSQRRDVRKTVVVASWWMRGGGCCGCGIGGDIGT